MRGSSLNHANCKQERVGFRLEKVFVQCAELLLQYMPRGGIRGCMTPRTLEELLDLSLKHLPTAFARLAFIAALRDPYIGRYLHEGWTSIGSFEEIHEVLRSRHYGMFELVSGFPMPKLCAELKRYFDSLSTPREQTARLWSELESYREMIPAGTSTEEREFFVSQMRAAVAVLITVPDWNQLRELSSWQLPQLDQQFPRHLEN